MKKKGFNDKDFSIIKDLDLGIAKRETIFNRLKNPKIGIVVSSYYADIARDLTFGADEVLKKNNIPRKNIIIWNAPGILEIPVMIAKNIHSCSAFIALGCVIKGETPHFDLISKTTIKAIMDLSIKYKKPIGNGIITCLNKKQAAERSDRTKKIREERRQELRYPYWEVLKVKQHNGALSNPRVIVIQKLYGHQLNKDSEISFPKHRYKKFIRDVVNGTIERKELIQDLMDKELSEDINENKTELMIKLMIMAAIYEFMFMHKSPINVVISEYLKVADFFVQKSQKSFLNAILEKISKVSRVKKG